MRRRLVRMVIVLVLIAGFASNAHAGFIGRLIFTPLTAFGGLYLGGALGVFLAGIIAGPSGDFWDFFEDWVIYIPGLVIGGGVGAIWGGFIGYRIGEKIDGPGIEDLESYYRREVGPHLGLVRHVPLFRLPLAAFAI